MDRFGRILEIVVLDIELGKGKDEVEMNRASHT